MSRKPIAEIIAWLKGFCGRTRICMKAGRFWEKKNSEERHSLNHSSSCEQWNEA